MKDELRTVEAALKKLGKHPAPKKTQVRAAQEVREATVTEDGPQGTTIAEKSNDVVKITTPVNSQRSHSMS